MLISIEIMLLAITFLVLVTLLSNDTTLSLNTFVLDTDHPIIYVVMPEPPIEITLVLGAGQPYYD
jgi:NADH:ubiquinone oxidoreductase subunit K